MARLYLFDLDQTLVDTADMRELRESGVHRTDAAYAEEVEAAFRHRERKLIDEGTLYDAWINNNMDLQFGVFTRSPRRYVDTVLKVAYPDFAWNVVIAYEDVQARKPNGEGIHAAMRAVGLDATMPLSEVTLIGDSDVDIRAAYHAGCRAVLFKAGWPNHYEASHWNCLRLLPDAVADSREELLTALANPIPQLPDLECRLIDPTQAPASPRFDGIGKFFPNDHTRHLIYAAGRSFAGYRNLDARRDWHELSRSIHDNKNVTVFPDAWIASVRRFIAHQNQLISLNPLGGELVVCVIPPRQGRVPRLNHLLAQLQASYGANPALNRLRLTFDAGMLAYRNGVRSHHGEHLSQEERFANVRDHLFVAKPQEAPGRRFLVIDDVSTTGATLLYAKKYLLDAGARSVECFSIAMNISDPL